VFAVEVVLDWYEGQEQVDLSDYVNSGTWDIIECPGFINYTFDDVEGHHKALITFTLRIRRKTLFYTVNLIIPCVLISFLSVCVFYLPADAGEKMTMCISIGGKYPTSCVFPSCWRWSSFCCSSQRSSRPRPSRFRSSPSIFSSRSGILQDTFCSRSGIF